MANPIDGLMNWLGLGGPGSSGGRDAGVPAKDFAAAFDTQGHPIGALFELEQRRAEQEALARARGYPSAAALLAAEPNLIADPVDPFVPKQVVGHPTIPGQRALRPVDELRAEALMGDLAAGYDTWAPVFEGGSRLIGGLIDGKSLAEVLRDPYYANQPEVYEALRDKGAPELLSLLAELMVPDGMGPLDELVKFGALAVPASRMLRRRPDVLREILQAANTPKGAVGFFEDLVDHSGARRMGDMYRIRAPNDAGQITLSGPQYTNSSVPYAYIDTLSRDVATPVGSREVAETLSQPLYWADAHNIPIVTSPSQFTPLGHVSGSTMPTQALRDMYNSLGFEVSPRSGLMVRWPMPLNDVDALKAEDAIRVSSFQAFDHGPLSPFNVKDEIARNNYPTTARLRVDPDTGQVIVNQPGQATWEPFETRRGARVRIDGDDAVFEYADGSAERFRGADQQWEYTSPTGAARRISGPGYQATVVPSSSTAPSSTPSPTTAAGPSPAPSPFRLQGHSSQQTLEAIAGSNAADIESFARRYFQEPSVAQREAMVTEALINAGFGPTEAGLEQVRRALMSDLELAGGSRDLIPRRIGGSPDAVQGMADATSALGNTYELGDAALDTEVTRVLDRTGLTREEYVEGFVTNMGDAEWAETMTIQALIGDGDSPREARETAARIRDAYEARLGISYEYPPALRQMATTPARRPTLLRSADLHRDRWLDRPDLDAVERELPPGANERLLHAVVDITGIAPMDDPASMRPAIEQFLIGIDPNNNPTAQRVTRTMAEAALRNRGYSADEAERTLQALEILATGYGRGPSYPTNITTPPPPSGMFTGTMSGMAPGPSDVATELLNQQLMREVGMEITDLRLLSPQELTETLAGASEVLRRQVIEYLAANP